MDFFYKEKKREREIVRMYLARWREGEVARGLEVKGSRGKGVLRSRGREVLRSRGLEVKGSRGLEVKRVRWIPSGKTTSSSFPVLNVSQESFVP